MLKPMLAATVEDLSALRYPLYASPKLDGVRALVVDGQVRSRSWKPFPNKFVQARFSKRMFEGLDGELILGSPTAKDVFRVTSGACQRHEGEPDVRFYAFDDFSRPALRYADRIAAVQRTEINITPLENRLIQREVQLLEYETEMLERGYEGLILRSPDGAYKFGRSTMREQGMMKLKRFTDSEFLLKEVEEEMENQNEAKRNAFGRTERSSARAGLVGKGRAGTLVGTDLATGQEVRMGTGMNDKDKEWFWKNRRKAAGKFVGKYKHFAVGAKDKPRFPVYLGERPGWDR